MNNAIKDITQALDQQMELNFFLASQLVKLSPPDEQKHLKRELHTRLSSLRERTLKATCALDDLVSNNKPCNTSFFPRSRNGFLIADI